MVSNNNKMIMNDNYFLFLYLLMNLIVCYPSKYYVKANLVCEFLQIGGSSFEKKASERLLGIVKSSISIQF